MNGPALLTRYIKDSGLSQAAFAAQVGVSGAAISLWARGIEFPAAGSALLLQSATGGAVPFSAWCNEDGSRKSVPKKRPAQRPTTRRTKAATT